MTIFEVSLLLLQTSFLETWQRAEFMWCVRYFGCTSVGLGMSQEVLPWTPLAKHLFNPVVLICMRKMCTQPQEPFLSATTKPRSSFSSSIPRGKSAADLLTIASTEIRRRKHPPLDAKGDQETRDDVQAGKLRHEGHQPGKDGAAVEAMSIRTRYQRRYEQSELLYRGSRAPRRPRTQ
ncbi:hypothetical protein BKA81DRAFT_380115 [Phyllosticta paracitricarpa]